MNIQEQQSRREGITNIALRIEQQAINIGMECKRTDTTDTRFIHRMLEDIHTELADIRRSLTDAEIGNFVQSDIARLFKRINP